MGYPSVTSDRPATRDAAPSPRFSDVLREATAQVHREAERTGFVADLLRGRSTRAGYALFLRNLLPVYAALETALDRHVARGKVGVLLPFTDPRLRRSPALLADLEALAGAGWQRTCPVLPEAEAYARAIRGAGQLDGQRLAAHAYTRYLGDLSGGQILKPLLARLYGLAPQALAFHDFPAFADLRAPKIAMREALDTIPPDEAGAIVAEAIGAFRLNIALSDAVRREATPAAAAV